MIDLVTRSLVEHLAAHTPDLGATWVEVSALDAGHVLTADKLHVCLYGIAEHDHLRNAPLVETPAGWQRPPLALRLSYVMTYAGGSHLEAQARLARVLQVFHTTPVLGPSELPAELAAQVDRLTVQLLSLDDDQRNALWTAFGRGMRLALHYLVDVALVPPLLHEGAGTVRTHRITFRGARR